ncbi:triphosphoribosyl-dephospho-CoA synthase [Geobacter pickeringii]|uniref:triphosphoribosyl-dephospho-CoA synthase n=1 Tax=Geobacter pickeringii TaxID=345632 RepID=A0A0B5BDE9_9BACT|nr:triphosphoribosyl-dephospho-CoA synthase [Geobacter pickeringii]AJE02565.1 2-(5'-triphosphoribosyl)-3'-dephospho CoA synthase [Geobacter pickeringii]
MNASRIMEIERFAQALVKGAAMQLYLTPKPGLVDLVDCGSHPDLSLAKMERSLHIIGDYLAETIRSLADGERFLCQAVIGRRAEQVMLDELGTNTHRGYIFLSGLLLISRWHAGSDDAHRLGQAVAALAREYFAVSEEQESNGHAVRKRFGAGGIVRESLAGLPSLFSCAVPAYLDAIDRVGCFTAASFSTLARLMQTVEDTTTLHRCGTMGLARIRRDGQLLEQTIDEGADFMPLLAELNREYTRMNLTMGGVADMLGLAYGYLTAAGLLTGDAGKSRRPRPLSLHRCASGT